MRIHIELTVAELKKLVIDHLQNQLGMSFDKKWLDIKVKSKLNYKAEWEDAEFKAVYDHDTAFDTKTQ